MNIQGDNFKLFAPIHISKGKSGDGKTTVMKMKGVASTSSTDSDKETLYPDGFELKYFLDHGYMNWNHQTNKNPLSIIGRPTSAKINKGRMEIECELFDHNPLAKDVYKLAEILEKQGSGLGYSIEGKVIERDKKDKSKVLKAQITGCAITPNPKNTDAVAKIVKGVEAGELDIIKGMYSAYEDTSDDEQEKAMSAGSESGQALSEESVDKDIKSKMEKSKKKLKKKLKKGEVLELLVKSHPNIKGGQIEELYTIIETIEKKEQMSKSKIDISEESISKAYEILGISKGESSEVEKTETEVEETEVEETETEAEKTETEVKKTETEVEETETEAEKTETEVKKTETEVEETETEAEKTEVEKTETEEAETETDRMIIKGESYIVDGDSFVKGDERFDFSKGEMILQEAETEEDDLMKGISNLIKEGFSDQKSSNDEKFKAMARLNKGLSNQLEGALGRIEKIESTPNPTKSVTRASFIEKSFDSELGSEEGKGNNIQLSVGQHRGQIISVLDKKAGISKGEMSDMNLANDICLFESTSGGTITPLIHKALKEEGITLVK